MLLRRIYRDLLAVVRIILLALPKANNLWCRYVIYEQPTHNRTSSTISMNCNTTVYDPLSSRVGNKHKNAFRLRNSDFCFFFSGIDKELYFIVIPVAYRWFTLINNVKLSGNYGDKQLWWPFYFFLFLFIFLILLFCTQTTSVGTCLTHCFRCMFMHVGTHTVALRMRLQFCAVLFWVTLSSYFFLCLFFSL